MKSLPRTLIVMGVSGAGKSLIGALLAKALEGEFEDGDDFHPPANKAKMSAKTPLTDEDRWPWLAILRERIMAHREQPGCYVLACSALKKIYRDALRGDDGRETLDFVYLKGNRGLVGDRLAARKGHFMPPTLLDSQYATLEEPEEALVVNVDQTPEEIVGDIVRMLGQDG